MKSGKKRQILLFEDDAAKAATYEKAFKRTCGSQFEVVKFDASKAGTEGAYEDRLQKAISPQLDKLVLIVTDRDLSKLKPLGGLSEAIVSKVATDAAIPVCVYAAGKHTSLLERQRSGGGGRILLSSESPDAMARKVRVLAEGFVEIGNKVDEINASRRKHAYRGPATVLAELLGATEVVDQLALYTRGDQRMIAGLTPTKSAGSRATMDSRRVALSLGVWLYDSILRFPGVILGAKAAGSLLGIDCDVLQQAPIAKVFAKAAYQGPFADDGEPRWWRHRLAELLTANGANDGRDLVKKRTKRVPKACVCSVDKRAPAGYLCVMTDEPICEEHSVGQVGWLPRGADLARVRRDLFEEIGPWVGMT